jgi:hypothetical protein
MEALRESIDRAAGSGLSPGLSPKRYYWLIVKRERFTSMRALRIDLLTPGEGEALTVFSSEKEARTYLRLRTTRESGWEARQTSSGELISILCGPCADVGRVVLDPVGEPGGEVLNSLLSLSRARFLGTSLSPGYAPSRGRPASRPPAPPPSREGCPRAAIAGTPVTSVA